MNRKIVSKLLSFKIAIPTLVITGLLMSLGHQLIFILAGAGMTLEHRLNYGKWWDKGRYVCHGKAGVLLLLIGCTIALASIL